MLTWLCVASLIVAPEGCLAHASFDGSVAEQVSGPAVQRVAGLDGVTLTDGHEGQAASFASATCTVELNRPLPREAGTIALWVRPEFDAMEGANHVFLHCPATAGESADNWQIQWREERALLFRAGRMGLSDVYLTGLRFAPGQWLHLAMTWDVRSLTIWVDGRRAAVRIGPDLTVEPGNRLILGGWGGTDRPADATLDDVQVYDRKLTATEIAELAGGIDGAALGPGPAATRQIARPGPLPPPGNEPGLILHLDFETWPVPWLRLVTPKGAQPDITAVPGRVGQAMEFTSGGVTANLGDLLPAEQGTFALWLRPQWNGDAEGSKVILYLASTSRDSTDNYHIQLYGGALSVRAGAMPGGGHAGADLNSRSIQSWRAGEWHHVAFTWSPERVRLYLDGQPAGERAGVDYPYRPQDRLTIGCWSDGSRPAEAAVDDLRIYARELTADEVLQLAR